MPMLLRSMFSLLLLTVLATTAFAQDAPVFSGPQVGETLPPLKVKVALGEMQGKEIDIVEQVAGQPLLLIFFHSRTRPAFGLTRAVTAYATSKAKAGLQTHVVFLTADPTDTEKWMGVVKNNLPKEVVYSISGDGIEGPGAYGLNRNVTLTVLVGKDGKVTENLALIQPQLQADGPKIVQAIADVTGGGSVPSMQELEQQYMSGAGRMDQRRNTPASGRTSDEKLTGLLRGLINKQATPEQVKQAAESVEKYVSENDDARKELLRIATTVVNSDRLENYGTAAAQEVLKGWVKKYADEKR